MLISSPNFKPNLLDIGSGLGVFPYIVEKNGWECTAIDPDNRSIQLIKQNTNVKTICGDFMELKYEMDNCFLSIFCYYSRGRNIFFELENE